METAWPLYIKSNCPNLWEFLSGLHTAERDQLIKEILDSANFRSAAGRVEDLLTGDASDEVRQILTGESVRLPFLAAVAGSRFLFSILQRNTSLLDSIFRRKGYLIRKTRPLMERELRDRIKGSPADRGLGSGTPLVQRRRVSTYRYEGLGEDVRGTGSDGRAFGPSRRLH